MRIFLFFTSLLIIGLGIFAYASSLPEYHNLARFEAADSALLDRYYGDNPNSLPPGEAHEAQFTDEYYAIRKKERTLRGPLVDASLCLMIIAVGGMGLFFRGTAGLKTPPNKWMVLLVGLAGAAATLFGVGISMQADDSPPWADSNYRGAAVGLFVMMWVLPLFVGAHGAFLIGRKFSLQTQVFNFNIRHANRLLILALSLWALMTAFIISASAWYCLLASPLWLYFYLSLLAIRAKGHELKNA